MKPTRSAKVPGRVTVIGGHTGDNQGILISVAIPRYVQVSIEETSKGFLALESDAFPGELRFGSLDRIEPHWAKYVVGALLSAGLNESEILRRNVQITSDLPMRRGLASSAALVSATLLAANEKLVDLPRDELLQLCANVERKYAGVNCGVLDYYTNLFAVEGHLLKIDCKCYTHKAIRWPADITLMVCDTGEPRQLVDSEFNLRRAQCSAVAKAADKESLRDVSQADVDRLRGKMPIEAKRADHVLSEINRVGQFANEVRRRNFAAMKHLMAAAHRSLAVNYECSSFEQDLLVDEANKFDCCIGSRMTGAGWGGATIHLVHEGHEKELAYALHEEFKSATKSELRVYSFKSPVAGWIGGRQGDSDTKSEPGSRSSFETASLPG